MRTVIIPGILRPRSDFRLLASVMHRQRLAQGQSVLDLFCGSGVLAVTAALSGARSVTAVDISSRAVLNTRLNAWLNRVSLEVVRGDMFAPVAGRRFDLIVANPPYVPSAGNRLPERGAARAWEGGLDGRLLIDRFCGEVSEHLAPGGTVLLVQSSLCGEQPTQHLLAAGGLDANVAARSRGPLGPIIAERAAMLERRGLLASGEREEELLVFRADAKAAVPVESAPA